MKKFIIFLILIISLFYITGRYYYNTNIEVKEYTIKDSSIPNNFNGFKIVHFSDILYNKKITSLNLLVDTINNQDPDVIIFTGDLIKHTISEDEENTLYNSLNSLKCKLFKYAILGDHDNETVEEILKKANFTILKDEEELLYYEDSTPIRFINKTYNEENDYYTISLIHKPDEFTDMQNNKINIFFAGHSLGGQIRLPFINGLIKKDGAKIYTNDYYYENNSKLYISYGIGNETTNIRFLNKPSINVYRLFNK